MALKAVGFIDTRGYVAAVASADEALKAADVHLINKEYVRNGMVTIILTGDVAAVSSSMEAAVSQSKRMNAYISHHVIARPDDQLCKLFGRQMQKDPPPDPNDKRKEKLKAAVDVLEGIKEKKQQSKPLGAETVDLQPSEESAKAFKPLEPSKEPAQKALGDMKVEELRRVARDMYIKDVSRNDIKFMKKKQLLELIEKNSKKEV